VRKNLEVPKDKKGKVKNGLHQVGEVCVDTGQIGITDPCRSDFDITVDTNFGDGLFPVYENWHNNERLALVIPLATEMHNALADHCRQPKKSEEVKS
jgi:hypothetical protein|tara:strand:- start:1149 stop:1439 length:291 start_codon:yes stop_codon:yes gene_type:complete